MHHGIVHALKLRYRCRQLHKIIMEMNTDTTLNRPHLLKQIYAFEAIYWNELDNTTIEKCLKWCGFIHQDNVEINTDNESGDPALIVSQTAKHILLAFHTNTVLKLTDNLVPLIDITALTQNTQDMLFLKKTHP